MEGVILTQRGKERITQKLGMNETMNLSYISVGDGGGDAGVQVLPDDTMTHLVRERWRVPITDKSVHPENPVQVMLEGHIPSHADGMPDNFFITEIGVWDDGEDNGGVPELIAVGDHPKIQKTSPLEGHANEIRLVLPILIGGVAQELINLSIDPSVVYATKQTVDRITPVYGIEVTGKWIDLPGNTANYCVAVTPMFDQDRTFIGDVLSAENVYIVNREMDRFYVDSADRCYFSYIVLFMDEPFSIPDYYTKPVFTPFTTTLLFQKDRETIFQSWATNVSPGEMDWEQSRVLTINHDSLSGTPIESMRFIQRGTLGDLIVKTKDISGNSSINVWLECDDGSGKTSDIVALDITVQ